MAQAATAAKDGGHQTELADNRYTRRIAQFVSGLTYDKIPAEVRHRPAVAAGIPRPAGSGHDGRDRLMRGPEVSRSREPPGAPRPQRVARRIVARLAGPALSTEDRAVPPMSVQVGRDRRSSEDEANRRRSRR